MQGTAVSFEDVAKISETIRNLIAEDGIDTCSIVYNRFVNAITQTVTFNSLVPAELDQNGDAGAEEGSIPGATTMPEYEPNEASVLEDLLPRALSTAMDNATRNAGDLIDRLTMVYNRSRQAAITTELIEIISGAEAL